MARVAKSQAIFDTMNNKLRIAHDKKANSLGDLSRYGFDFEAYKATAFPELYNATYDHQFQAAMETYALNLLRLDGDVKKGLTEIDPNRQYTFKVLIGKEHPVFQRLTEEDQAATPDGETPTGIANVAICNDIADRTYTIECSPSTNYYVPSEDLEGYYTYSFRRYADSQQLPDALVRAFLLRSVALKRAENQAALARTALADTWNAVKSVNRLVAVFPDARNLLDEDTIRRLEAPTPKRGAKSEEEQKIDKEALGAVSASLTAARIIDSGNRN